MFFGWVQGLGVGRGSWSPAFTCAHPILATDLSKTENSCNMTTMAAVAAREKRRMKSALNHGGGRRRADAPTHRLADFLGCVIGQTNPGNDLEFERRMTPFGHLLSGQPFSDNGANWVGAHGYRYGNYPFAQVNDFAVPQKATS